MSISSAGKHSPDICSGTSFFYAIQWEAKMRSERSRDMYHLPIVNFSFMNGDLGGIIYSVSQHSLFSHRPEKTCSAQGQLFMNFTEPLPHFYAVIWANLL